MVTKKASKQEIVSSVLKTEDISHFDKDIRKMNRSELVANFSAPSSGRVVLARLMKNIIWQAYEKISIGAAPKISGNIRTFWYLWIKPVLSRLPEDSDLKSDPYAVMTSLFTEMVMDLKLFKYQDFDFADENWENRRIGTTKPEIIVFAEKSGWLRFLKEIHQEMGVSILTLGGFPSALTSEYTARDMDEVLKGKPARLIGIVDYDPSGEIVAKAFLEQLSSVSFPVSSLDTVISPKHYSKEEIEMFKFRLPKAEKTKLKKWMDKTNGIEGKPYGLESESMPLDRLKAILKDLISSTKS